MGHYDLDRSGPGKHEIQKRRRAYETKQNNHARSKISDRQVRAFLAELNECREADGLTCREGSYCSVKRHAQDVLIDDKVFDAAQTLVEHGVVKSEYEAIGTNRITEQLVALCQDAHLISMGLKGQKLTDEGHHVMLGDDFERPEMSWDEERAQKWDN